LQATHALFHKYLDIDIELKNSSVKKHEAIKAKLKFSNNKFYQVFVKLQNLRIWADYRYEQDKKVIETDLLRLINDVYAIVKRKKNIVLSSEGRSVRSGGKGEGGREVEG
jgi:phosphopantetheine adenylyltransferase